jgi:hypothetical protein
VQVDLIKPTLKAPGTERLKLECDELLSKCAFNFNLRRYNQGTARLASCGDDGVTARPRTPKGLTPVHFSAQRKHILWGTLGA